MPRDGSGVYSLPAGNPVVTNTIIESAWANTTLGDIAAQLNNVYTRDGLLGPTGPFKLQDGTVNAPGLAWNSEPGLGMYRAAASKIAWASNGQQVMAWDTSTAANTTIAVGPRAASGGAGLNLFSTSLGTANYGVFSISMQASGSAVLTTSAIGGAPANSISLAPANGVAYLSGGPTGATAQLVMNALVGGNSQIGMNKSGASTANNIVGSNNNNLRWLMQMGSEASETGANEGSDFILNRYADGGAYLGTAMSIKRSTGLTTVQGFLATGSSNFGAPMTVGSSLTINIAGNGQNSLVINQTMGGGNYAGIVMLHPNGGKTIRVGQDNRLEFVNWANTAILGGLNDSGRLSMKYGYTTQFGTDAGDSGNTFNLAYDPGGGAGRVYMETSWVTMLNPSDERRKDNIVDLEVDDDVFMGIRTISFDWKPDDLNKEYRPSYGFSAQQLLAHLPNTGVVSGTEETLYGVAELPLLAMTVNRVQDLIRRITQLENA